MSKMPLLLLCTIVERGKGQKVARVYAQQSVDFSYRLSGTGTASSDLLDILGIGTAERDILVSPVARAQAEALVRKIHQEGLGGGIHAKGILCAVPLNAASAKIAGALLRAEPAGAKEEAHMENTTNQSMILIAVSQGYTEAVMTTAKAVGARGGTVLRSHILRNEESADFGGPTFAGERDVIVIVAGSRSERNAIMESVDKVHGGDSAAHAVLYSLPIELTAHLS